MVLYHGGFDAHVSWQQFTEHPEAAGNTGQIILFLLIYIIIMIFIYGTSRVGREHFFCYDFHYLLLLFTEHPESAVNTGQSTEHCIALHYFASHCIAWHCTALRYCAYPNTCACACARTHECRHPSSCHRITLHHTQARLTTIYKP